MEKERLVNFIATIMEDSGFKTYKNYKASNQMVDIYGILNTSVGNVGVVVACKNYEEPWKIGLDVLKDMEIAARSVHASKIIIFTTSSFTHRAAVYAQKRNIKLVDRRGLIKIAKNYSQRREIVSETTVDDDYDDYEYYEPENTKPASLNPHNNNSSRSSSHGLFKNKSRNKSYQYQNNYSKPSSYLNKKTSSLSNFSLDISGYLTFFTEHSIVYMIILIVIASAISYLLTMITSGPYTGIGKIVSSGVICFGGLLLINRNMSDVIFKGFVIFFISMIVSIIMLTF